MKIKYFGLFFLLILLFSFSHSYSTHIRAGEITAIRTNIFSYSYRFTFTGFRDSQGQVQFGGGKINFGDGSGDFVLDDIKISHIQEELGNFVEKNTIIFDYTFPNAQEYIISYREENRNDMVLTMSNSVTTPFYIETKIILDPFFGENNTPILLVPPVDKAATGVLFIHNPGAFDLDGDSLSYKIVENKQDRTLSVNNFKYPIDQSLYTGMDYDRANQAGTGRPTYTLDPITGDLVWDAPGIKGEYNVAMIIEEWRKIQGKWYFLGYVTRDMQILVEGTDNMPPVLSVPKDTCIVAGSLLEQQITSDDPEGHQVKIETFSGVYALPSSPASFAPDPPVFAPVIATMDFRWQTNGTHVRSNPYQVIYKATDRPPLGPGLVDIQTWNITVVGPAPQNVTANVEPGKSVSLNWNPYRFRNQAEKMQVWRRKGSFDFDPANCETGVPVHAGYELVAEANIQNSSFLDDNKGNGLLPGVTYCYRLVAVWPLPGGGESYASEEVCVEMAADVPLITNVSIENTSTIEGMIFVRWTSPFDVDQAQFPPPYTYGVVRSVGITGRDEMTVVGTTTDTTFVDIGLNTSALIYNYRIVLFDANNTMVDTSAAASSVRLEADAQVGAIELSWRAEVPWSNMVGEYPYHLIYRNDGEDGPLVLIDSVNVNVNGFRYMDQGQYNGVPLVDTKNYCYLIETRGSYGNPRVIAPLLNKSQVVCAMPNDLIPPCEPALSLDLESLEDCQNYLADKPCNFNSFSNTLRWTDQEGTNCDDDIRRYNIYYSPTGEEGTFKIVSPPDLTGNTFVHKNLLSLAGCYMITSVDRSGNESPFSEMICNENCTNYELPNVFTPNGDDINDTFRPKDCPRFVESVTLRVVNRWGKEVYSFTSSGDISIFINWDGKTNDGQELPTGVYYYVAEVKFTMRDPSRAHQTFKGWVQILR